MGRSIPLPLLCVLTLGASLVRADQEASNLLYVKTSRYGNCYLKAIPDEAYGTTGTIRIFGVRRDEDALLHTFNWYSQRVFIECNVVRPPQTIAVSVVRLGGSPSGSEANQKDLAIEFYFGDELVRTYSTLDIAGSPRNVLRSVSHYNVVSRVYGYRRQKSNAWTFELLTTDGRRLAFDPADGKLVSTTKTILR